jgi:hypothetical protein
MPQPSDPETKREGVAELLGRSGYGKDRTPGEAVRAWRAAHQVPIASVRTLGAAVIAHFDALSARNVLPHLPAELHDVPRANIQFLPIRDAWFSGSMNYLGRARRADGSPEYEATYEINASLEISVPEFLQLVSHEVVPGHVTTFAYLQNLYWRGEVGFEASVLTMNTRAAALFEGIANNAILMAHDATEVQQLPDEDLQIGVLAPYRTMRKPVVLSPGARCRKPRSHPFCTGFPGFPGAREVVRGLEGTLFGRMYAAYRAEQEGGRAAAPLMPKDVLPVSTVVRDWGCDDGGGGLGGEIANTCTV